MRTVVEQDTCMPPTYPVHPYPRHDAPSAQYLLPAQKTSSHDRGYHCNHTCDPEVQETCSSSGDSLVGYEMQNAQAYEMYQQPVASSSSSSAATYYDADLTYAAYDNHPTVDYGYDVNPPTSGCGTSNIAEWIRPGSMSQCDCSHSSQSSSLPNDPHSLVLPWQQQVSRGVPCGHCYESQVTATSFDAVSHSYHAPIIYVPIAYLSHAHDIHVNALRSAPSISPVGCQHM